MSDITITVKDLTKQIEAAEKAAYKKGFVAGKKSVTDKDRLRVERNLRTKIEKEWQQKENLSLAKLERIRSLLADDPDLDLFHFFDERFGFDYA